MPSTIVPASPPADHRGWVRRMVLWSAALAVPLLLLAWGAANWKAFTKAYCRHLLASGSGEKQARALQMVCQYHLLEPGMTEVEVVQHLRPLVSSGEVSSDGKELRARFRVGPLGLVGDGYPTSFRHAQLVATFRLSERVVSEHHLQYEYRLIEYTYERL